MINSNQTTGALVFLVWSVFCSWHYACNIRGLCSRDLATTEIVSSSVAPVSELKETKSKPIEDPKPIVEEKPALEAISIQRDDIYFNLNSSQLVNEAEVTSFIDNLKNQIEGRKVAISIVGSTCDRGRASYNEKLGLKRAEAFKGFLRENGVSGAQIAVSSIGEIASIDGTEAEREKNRKVSITIKSLDT